MDNEEPKLLVSLVIEGDGELVLHMGEATGHKPSKGFLEQLIKEISGESGFEELDNDVRSVIEELKKSC